MHHGPEVRYPGSRRRPAHLLRADEAHSEGAWQVADGSRASRACNRRNGRSEAGSDGLKAAVPPPAIAFGEVTRSAGDLAVMAASACQAVYLMIWMSQRAPGAALMRSSPVTRTAPVSSARATYAAS